MLHCYYILQVRHARARRPRRLIDARNQTRAPVARGRALVPYRTPPGCCFFVLRSCSVPFSRQACVFKHQTKVAKHFLVWCFFFLTCERTRVPEGAAPGLGVRRCWLPRVRSRVEPCCRLVEVTTSAVEVTTIAPSKSQLAPSKSHGGMLDEPSLEAADIARPLSGWG